MTNPSLPTAGDRFGRYIVDGEIARGGFSVVLRARHDDGQLVALKLLSPPEDSPTYSTNLTERFAREARLLTQIRSPFTVKLLEYGSDDATGLLYMAFELVQGLSLFELIKRDGPQPPERMLGILKQCLLGLNRAHEVGILHRDLKPNNIMLFDDGLGGDRVKVIDFGIAKRLGEDAQDLTSAGTLVGTPRYMSPEQIRGSEIGPASDIYSLGLCMVEVLTARKAVWGKSRTDVITRQLDVSNPVPVPDDIPTPVRRIVGKMVAKVRIARYQTCHDVLRDIDRYNQGIADQRAGDTVHQNVDEDSLSALIAEFKPPPDDETVLQSVRIDSIDIPQMTASPDDQTLTTGDLDRTVSGGGRNRHESAQSLPSVPDDSRSWSLERQSTPSSASLLASPNGSHVGQYPPNPNASHVGPYPPNPNASHVGPYSPNPNASHVGPYPPNPNVSHVGPYPPNPNASHVGPYPPNPNASHVGPYPPNPNGSYVGPYPPNPNGSYVGPYPPNPNASHVGPYPPNPNGSYVGPYPPNPNASHVGPYPPNPNASYVGAYPPNPNASYVGPHPTDPNLSGTAPRQPSQRIEPKKPQPVGPLLASLIIPGTGHVIAGYRIKGALFVASWIMFVVLIALFAVGGNGMLDYALGLVAAVALVCIIALATVDLWLTRRANRHREVKPLELLPDLADLVARLK